MYIKIQTLRELYARLDGKYSRFYSFHFVFIFQSSFAVLSKRISFHTQISLVRDFTRINEHLG